MSNSLKLLLLEDDPLDAELNITALEAEGYRCEWKRVQTKKEFTNALKEPSYDIILIDYNLPAFDGLSALHILRELAVDIPAILVSGNLGEELAIESIKAGAVDYVHKDRLNRLTPSVKRALEEFQLKRKEKFQANNLALFNKLNRAANSGKSILELAEIVATETSKHTNYFGATTFLLSEDQQYFEIQDISLPQKMRETLEKLIGRPVPKVRIDVSTQKTFQRLLNNREIALFETKEALEEVIFEIIKENIPKTILISAKKLASAIPQVLSLEAFALLPLALTNQKIGILVFPYKEKISEDDISHMQAIAEQLTEIFSRKLAEEQIRLQLSRLDSLHSIDVEILTNVDLKTILTTVLEQVQSGLSVDAAVVLTFDASIQSLKYVAQVGFRAEKLSHKYLRLGKGLVGKTALERKRIHIKDLNKHHFEETSKIKSENFISYFGLPLLAQGKLKGVLEIFHRSPLNPDADWLKFMDTLARQAAIAIDNVSLFEVLQKNNIGLRLAYDTTLEGWARALELRDVETVGHSRRVSTLTAELATAMGIDRRLMDHIRRGALLHDIGKMGIPDSILLKNGPLTKEERKEIEKHPVYAYEMLKNIVFLKPALDIPYSHHEKWDGTGYPLGMHGAAIPLAARIFAIVDVYDALSYDRHYRKAWPKEKTLAYIREESGKHFDPEVVDIFLKLIAEREEDN